VANVNPMTYALVNILDTNILMNNSPIEILTDEPPLPSLDCVNLVERGGTAQNNTKVFDVSEPLPANHPYYNPNNPDDLYVQKLQRRRDQKGSMDIHVWANRSSDRDSVIKQIITVIDEAVMFNYKYCMNYNKTTTICKTTTNPCDALTNKNAYGVQGKCPFANITDPTDPNYRGPATYFDPGNINIFLIAVRSEQNVDDLSTMPETYHSVLPVDFEVTIVNEVPVNPLCEIDTSSEVEVLSPKKINNS
jgi:hypothetical protein